MPSWHRLCGTERLFAPLTAERKQATTHLTDTTVTKASFDKDLWILRFSGLLPMPIWETGDYIDLRFSTPLGCAKPYPRKI
jgi:hypothetical protein